MSANELTVVYGGQWGSEGKGDVVAAMTSREMVQYGGRLVAAIRVGGPNAGHTILDAKGVERKVQSIPVPAFINAACMPCIGAAGVIDAAILLREMKWLYEIWDYEIPTLVIDRHATVITPENAESEMRLKGSIGSTGKGVGAATASKVMRDAYTFENWRKNLPEFSDYDLVRDHTLVMDTTRWINKTNSNYLGAVHFIVEGTQGYLLSLNTSGYYPYVTSRDCGPEAIMGQIGVNPRAFSRFNAVAVVRTFPIRVGGPSGPLPGEVNWDWMKSATNGYVTTPERTTVTNKERRIARFDWESFYNMLEETTPTELAVTFLDYIDPPSAGANSYEDLSVNAKGFLKTISEVATVRWASASPHSCFRIPEGTV